MAEAVVRIESPVGLHARPAAEFVRIAKSAAGTVRVGRPDATGVDGASILTVLTLGLEHGDEARVSVEGDDAEDVLEKLLDVLRTAQ